MFTTSYFANNYFAPRYFPKIGAIVLDDGVTLIFGDLKVNLKRIKFGNSLIIDHTRINRETRGGEIKIFRDELWTRQKRTNYSFEALSTEDVRELKNFILTSLGQDITLIDYEGGEWIGTVLNPDMEIIQTHENDPCGFYDVEIQFEGIRV